MTKFAIINAFAQSIETIDCSDIDIAERAAGLEPGAVDHAMVSRHHPLAVPDSRYHALVVSEHGLFVPPEHQFYFSIRDRLYAGNAVLYAVGDRGETVDIILEGCPEPTFWAGPTDIERAIRLGVLRRPQMSKGPLVVWEWPQPAPKGFGR